MQVKYIDILLLIFDIFLCGCFATTKANIAGNIQSDQQQHFIFGEDGGSFGLMSEPWKIADFSNIGYEYGGISKKCMDQLTNFSNATSKFIGCAMNNSRPLRYCENCVAEYLSVVNIYSNISKDPSGVKNNCREQILRADTIQLPVATYNFVADIWEKSSCNQCFDSPVVGGSNTSHPSNMTTALLEKINKTLECFNNTEFLQDETNVNNSVCSYCKHDYRLANQYYEKVEDENKLCSDLIDSMNYTRLAWANKYHCTGAKKDKGVLWVITALVGLLPFILYLGIVIYDKRYSRRHGYNQLSSCECENDS